MGNVTTYNYDSQCNLRLVRDAAGGTTEYRYNSAGQRTDMIDSNGSSWKWHYSQTGQIESITDPNGRSASYSFDATGRIRHRVDRNGRRIDLEYAPTGHLTKEKWSDGRIIAFERNSANQLTSIIDPDSTLRMTYDSLGRVRTVDTAGTKGMPTTKWRTSEGVTEETQGITLTYSYDEASNVIRVEDNGYGRGVVEYFYDGLNRLTRAQQSGASGGQPPAQSLGPAVAAARVDLVHDKSGLLREIRRFTDLTASSNLLNTTLDYDCGGCGNRITAIRHRTARGDVVHDLLIDRDPADNIRSVRDTEGRHDYVHDATGRLLSATHAGTGIQPNETYRLDSAGNRLYSHVSTTYRYSYQVSGGGNRLLDTTQYFYAYDNEGNRTRRTDKISGSYQEYEYDHRGRLTSVTGRSPTGVMLDRADYRYDGLNRRISASTGPKTTWLIYDGLNAVMKLAADGLPESRRLFSRDIDGALADQINIGQSSRSAVVRWFLSDQVGTIRDLFSQSDAYRKHYIYDSYGRVMAPSNQGPLSDNDILFGGREIIGPGLQDFRSRAYSPEEGVFLSEDPLLPARYEYAASSPLANRDPLGAFTAGEYSLIARGVATTALAGFAARATYGDCVERFRRYFGDDTRWRLGRDSLAEESCKAIGFTTTAGTGTAIAMGVLSPLSWVALAAGLAGYFLYDHPLE